jgi:hypothetical protein
LDPLLFTQISIKVLSSCQNIVNKENVNMLNYIIKAFKIRNEDLHTSHYWIDHQRTHNVSGPTQKRAICFFSYRPSTTTAQPTPTAEFRLAVNHIVPGTHDFTTLYLNPSGTTNLTPNISLASSLYIAQTSELWAITYSTTARFIGPQPVCFLETTKKASSSKFATHEEKICEKEVENAFYFQGGPELLLTWENGYFKGRKGDFATFCVKEEKEGSMLKVDRDARGLKDCQTVDIFVLPIRE